MKSIIVINNIIPSVPNKLTGHTIGSSDKYVKAPLLMTLTDTNSLFGRFVYLIAFHVLFW